jgi:alanine racemase
MRDATLLLNRSALLHNASRVRSCAPNSRILAMVKADAYGHGALYAAAVLASQVDALGVAFLEEGLALRDAGISAPIVLMEGVFNDYELATARALHMQPVVHQEMQLRLLEQAPQGAALTVWLKVNSGMNRLGFNPEEAVRAYYRLEACPGVGRIILCSHFATADEPDPTLTRKQISVMDALLARLPALPCSLSNSAGILAWPQSHRQWVRPRHHAVWLLAFCRSQRRRTGVATGHDAALTGDRGTIPVSGRFGWLWRRMARCHRHPHCGYRDRIRRRLSPPRPSRNAGTDSGQALRPRRQSQHGYDDCRNR